MYPEEPNMRLIPFVLTAFVVSSLALAQGWEEYAYPDYAFSVAFPANPQVETTTYHVADNRSVPAWLYSVRQGNVVFKMTVAELEGTNLEESAVIDHAIKTLSQGATVRVNIPARIYRVYGRQLTVEGADGSRSTTACGRRDLFTTGPGPDAGGSKPGKEGCDQILEKSGIAAPWAALLADGTAVGACPKAGVAAPS
jgi:hypothetical protein